MLLISSNVYAEEILEQVEEENTRTAVKLVNCTSSSNIWVSLDGKYKRITLIAYNKEDGSLNKEIDSYICDSLKKAATIEIEYDPKIVDLDSYNRAQVWLYIDGNLFQKELIKKGYGQVDFIKDQYNYLEELCAEQKIAISNSLGIWNYEGIDESYCKSGIKVGETIIEEEEKKDTVDEYEFKKLYFILLIDSGIVIFILILRSNRRSYEK